MINLSRCIVHRSSFIVQKCRVWFCRPADSPQLMDEDPAITFLIRRWANGESALPVVERLSQNGSEDEAAAVARLALASPECADRDELEAVLRRIASEPDGWAEALTDFARNPSEERWDELMQFVPDDISYQRLRTSVPFLMRLGCDGNILFRCVSRLGMIPDLFDLAASGTVDPEVIEERGEGSPARPTWLGLAAQAAFARDDRFGVLRYLREAMLHDENAYMAWGSISFIRDIADDELNLELDKVGVPRV
jgi:hypothetical protein